MQRAHTIGHDDIPVSMNMDSTTTLVGPHRNFDNQIPVDLYMREQNDQF